MIFLELNDGRTINLLHISSIYVEKSDVIYAPARGSLTVYKEHFDTDITANARYEELKAALTI